MNRTMREVSVSTTENGEIAINGTDASDPNDPRYDTITISPDQVDTLVKWMKEAQAELQGKP